ncbi:MAG: hypothetical protein ACOYOP_07570 [Microthrixaceae bacterium]
MTSGDPAWRAAVAEALDAAVPGSVELGALDYVERLLGAFDHDPPRIWAAPGSWDGPGGERPVGAPAWLELGPWERQAWKQRIAGWHEVYDRVASGRPSDDDLRVVHVHACEGTYGDPAYGGNRGGGGWARIGFPEPLHPPAREVTG